MKFLRVTNTIRRITSSEVEFSNNTTLRRVHDRKTVWKLLKDGVYVRREFALAYKLDFE